MNAVRLGAPESQRLDKDSTGTGRFKPQFLMLLAAVAAGVVAKGGYYLPGRFLVTALVALALVFALRTSDGSRRLIGFPLLGTASAALAIWAVTRTACSGAYDSALATAATIGCVAAAAIVAASAGWRDRELVAHTLIGIGSLVGTLAWIGVVWRVGHLAVLVESRVWRGGSTLTYPNALAALLAPLALLAIALLVTSPRPGLLSIGAYLCCLGVGATLSRAGALALAVGLGVLAAITRPEGPGQRRALRGALATLAHSAPPLAGALIGFAALAPSFPSSAEPRPLLAALGLAAGGAVTLVLSLVKRWRAVVAWAAVVLLGGFALVAAGRSSGMESVLSSRWRLGPYGRGAGAKAAVDLVREHPIIGTGVGQSRLFWQGPDGSVQTTLYVHNEYLQTLLDLGVIGAATLLFVIVAIVVGLARGGSGTTPAATRGGVWAGAIAALAALAVHSGFDFLWHITVLPLLGGLLFGLAQERMSTAS